MPVERSHNGDLHLWECPHIMLFGTASEQACGYVVRAMPGSEPGYCPYDHGEPVRLVPLAATALCSDCAIPVPIDDCRAPDNRLICGECAAAYIGKYPEDADERRMEQP